MFLICFGKVYLFSYVVKFLIIGVCFIEFYCVFDLLDKVVWIINFWFFFNNFKKKNKIFYYKIFDLFLERGVVYLVWLILVSYNFDFGGKVKNMVSL